MNYQAIYYAARMIKAYCEQTDCDTCPFATHDVHLGYDIIVCRMESALFPSSWELEDLKDEIQDL